jgi:hypothetical protein
MSYTFVLIQQDLYKQISWPLYKLYGHAFEAFKLMVADDGAAIIKRLEEERGPLTVFTPQVRLRCCTLFWECRILQTRWTKLGALPLAMQHLTAA